MNSTDFEKILFSEQEIEKRVDELADEINNLYGNNPVFLVSVLKGSAPFTVDLMKRLKMEVTLDIHKVNGMKL